MQDMSTFLDPWRLVIIQEALLKLQGSWDDKGKERMCERMIKEIAQWQRDVATAPSLLD